MGFSPPGFWARKQCVLLLWGLGFAWLFHLIIIFFSFGGIGCWLQMAAGLGQCCCWDSTPEGLASARGQSDIALGSGRKFPPGPIGMDGGGGVCLPL